MNPNPDPDFDQADAFSTAGNAVNVVKSWNRVAVLSAMFCIPFCCPPMTLLGAGTGMLALRSIRLNPETKGAWLAKTAIVFGLATTLLSVWLYWTSGLRTIVLGPNPALAALFAADTEGMRREWAGPASSLSKEQLDEFAEQVKKRYGTFVSSRYSTSRPTPLDQPGRRSVAVIPVTIQFDSGPVEADLGLERFDEKSGKSTMSWRSLRILDAARGDMLFPDGEPAPPLLENSASPATLPAAPTGSNSPGDAKPPAPAP
ncbi:MAG: hypothetical protein K8R92_06085 [Planctomycetes bacterium]|nr:hypothetical protein [Planctomycetota bacterium]